MTGYQLAIGIFKFDLHRRQEMRAWHKHVFCLCSCLKLHRVLNAVTLPIRSNAKLKSMLLSNKGCSTVCIG